MYQIFAFETPVSDVRNVVYSPKLQANVLSGKLSLIENEISNMTLSVGRENWLFGKAQSFQTHVEVYQDTKLIFRGRAIDVTKEMDNDGKFSQTIIFESIENYLKDSIQRFAKVQNTTPKQFLQNIINVHNNQVPDYKKMILRNVEVSNSTDNVYRYIDYVSTWETIQDKLVSRLGGYISFARENGKNYIDYLKINNNNDLVNKNNIILGKNLKSISIKQDPSDVITRLIPLGATIQNDNEDTQDAANPRVSIASVNSGVDYIDIPEFQSEFGIINGTNVWDDVNEPSILLSKAKQWIAAQVGSKVGYNISALELANFDHFNVSEMCLVSNQYLMDTNFLRVIQKDIDFNDPLNSSLTIGSREVGLSDIQLENISARRQARDMQNKIVASQSALNSLNNNFYVMNNQFDDLQKQIDDLNGGWQSGSLFVNLTQSQKGKPLEWYRSLVDENNVKGAVLELSKGKQQTNDDFSYQKSSVASVGMKFVGAFHVFTAKTVEDAKEEGAYFASRLNALGVSKSVIVANYLDMSNGISSDKNLLTECIDTFFNEVRSAGYLNSTDYAMDNFFENNFESHAAFKWLIKNKNNAVPYIANAWQFSDNIDGKGIAASKSYEKTFI